MTRSPQRRKKDALRRLEQDVDVWVATADLTGRPTLVPLAFWWSGTALVIATHRDNPTARNIVAGGQAVAVLGHSRDVVHIDTAAEPLDDVPPEYGDAFAVKADWDARESAGYRFFRLTPRTVESWRELDEHPDRRLMRDGNWLV